MRSLRAAAGVALNLALEVPIRLDKAAVGDPVEAVLTSPATIIDGVKAPKGARVHGRIMHLARNDVQRYHGFSVGMDLFEISWPGTEVQVRAVLETISSPSPQFMVPGGRQTPSHEHGKIMGSIFFVRSNVPVTLSKGFRMNWRTLAAEIEDHQ
jgi:hypothetical protein